MTDAYSRAGVNLDEAARAMKLIEKHILSTHNERVLSNIGSFGGLYDASFLKKYESPVLITSMDGVGTKMILAEMTNNWPVGQCIINHCINDILCSGAIPLYFADYVASSKLRPEILEQIVAQMAIACRTANIPIITGETAEMPGVYQEGRHDMVGHITGVVERDRIINGLEMIEEGDVLIGLLSNGLHTNGYSLARPALLEGGGFTVDTHLPELGCTIGEELLKVHKSYLKSVGRVLTTHGIYGRIHGIAHITGGGLYDNIGRLLKDGLCAEISAQWEIPPIFRLIQKIENVSTEEMRRVFNLGIGMVLIVPSKQSKYIRGDLRISGEKGSLLIGEIKKTDSKKEKVVFTY